MSSYIKVIFINDAFVPTNIMSKILTSKLEDTIEWFKENIHLYKPDIYNI